MCPGRFPKVVSPGCREVVMLPMLLLLRIQAWAEDGWQGIFCWCCRSQPMGAGGCRMNDS
eukprot:2983073-Amphidinium_carterae.1